jgi:hypothetical protein
MMRGGFNISIGLSPFANEGDMDDGPPEHHARSYEGDSGDYHRCCHDGHKALALHHKAMAEGDHKAAEHFADEADGHFAKANKIAEAHGKARQHAYGDGDDGE